MKHSDIKNILAESILETLNETQPTQSRDFSIGQRQAVYDKQRGIQNRDLSQKSAEYKKGYQSVMGGWWDRFNAKLTSFASNFGTSFRKR